VHAEKTDINDPSARPASSTGTQSEPFRFAYLHPSPSVSSRNLPGDRRSTSGYSDSVVEQSHTAISTGSPHPHTLHLPLLFSPHNPRESQSTLPPSLSAIAIRRPIDDVLAPMSAGGSALPSIDVERVTLSNSVTSASSPSVSAPQSIVSSPATDGTGHQKRLSVQEPLPSFSALFGSAPAPR